MERVSCNYKDLSSRFVIKSKDGAIFDKQFSECYFSRLSTLRPILQKSAPFGGTFVRVLDLTPGMQCVIGTVVKTMPLIPNLLKEYAAARVIGGFVWTDNTVYTSDKDTLALEDDSGRVKLSVSQEIIGNLVNGIVIAVRGNFTETGELEVLEIATAGIPEQLSSLPISTSESTRHVLFVSGLKIGSETTNPLQTDLLSDWISGRLGSIEDQQLAKSVCRVIIAGNTLNCTQTNDTIASTSGNGLMVQGSAANIARQLSVSSNILNQMETFLSSISSTCNVDIMPGPSDPANNALPQQKMNRILFPISSLISSFQLVTNPYSCEIDGKVFLGCAGQNLDNLMKTTTIKNKLVAMQCLLEWRHLAPSAPDTLCCLPFDSANGDPLLINSCPNVFFVSNQSEFQSDFITGPKGQKIRLLLVPDFSKTSIAVLVNIDTLEVRPISFSC